MSDIIGGSGVLMRSSRFPLPLYGSSGGDLDLPLMVKTSLGEYLGPGTLAGRAWAGMTLGKRTEPGAGTGLGEMLLTGRGCGIDMGGGTGLAWL